MTQQALPGPENLDGQAVGDSPPVTVVICAYDEARWDKLKAAVASVRDQNRAPEQCIVVVDHNERLLDRARHAFPDAEVVANAHCAGLSGARNTGVEKARGDVVAFLDDDAAAEPDWLESLTAPYADTSVVGTGGAVIPQWETGRPGWLPSEFYWVLGCSYRGLPTELAAIRNPIGANMSFRRSVFEEVGGFTTGIGRSSSAPLGCEETELSIRARAAMPGSCILQVPGAVVHHFVGEGRVTLRYYLRRCYAEGLSKAQVVATSGGAKSLDSERRYVRRVLPSGVLRGLGKAARGDVDGLIQSGMIVLGLVVTSFGYARDRLGGARREAAGSEGTDRGSWLTPAA